METTGFKKYLPILGIVGILAIGVFWYFGISNGAVKVDQEVKESWGNVQTSYQRRGDLIDNLVKTVKGAADFEKSTLEAVVNARAKATSVNIDPTNITPEQLKQFNETQSGVNSALSRLLVTVESYPQLKANENFLKLQDELASTENQILTSRNRFNEAVKGYNGYILKVPNKWFLGGYKEKPFFEADASSQKAPDVEFDFDKK